MLKFFLRKSEIRNKPEVEFTFYEILDVFLLLFQVVIQDYIKMRVPKNSAELFELLLKYESGNETDHGGVSGSPLHKGSLSNELNYLPSLEFRNAVM